MISTSHKIGVPDGTLEGLKWLAVILMTGDHANKYLFNGMLPVLFEAGRMALPIFLFVIAYNFSRPNRLEQGVYPRVLKRLLFFGCISCVPMYGLNTLLPLNILVTLFLLTAVTFLIECKWYIAATFAFTLFGYYVEYSWLALILGLAMWLHLRVKTPRTALLVLVSCASLYLINKNMWAMAVIPLLLISPLIDLKIPRQKWIFYAYYPFHLGVLWTIRIPMDRAGYLFFT